MHLICSFQDKCSSSISKTLRNFIDATLSTSLSFISTLESKSGRSSVLLGLWNREYFVFIYIYIYKDKVLLHNNYMSKIKTRSSPGIKILGVPRIKEIKMI